MTLKICLTLQQYNQKTMSEFIYDEVYGSEAKKNRIKNDPKYIYYRAMLKLRDKHFQNKALYEEVFSTSPSVPSSYQISNNKQTASSSLKHYHYGSSSLSSPTAAISPSKANDQQKLLATIRQNNYTIQKINPNAFKIVKRKWKAPSANDRSVDKRLHGQSRQSTNLMMRSFQQRMSERASSSNNRQRAGMSQSRGFFDKTTALNLKNNKNRSYSPIVPTLNSSCNYRTIEKDAHDIRSYLQSIESSPLKANQTDRGDKSGSRAISTQQQQHHRNKSTLTNSNHHFNANLSNHSQFSEKQSYAEKINLLSTR